ncbi:MULTISPECIES: enoyl-CoA hydratase-related protein [unclassified Arthrobacter]|uniref:enoyl-CoA hydratase/isomerase family protein n=1 Tax=unclassified Arthrobacter TaxID=235627 RepID=UPI001E38171F|nr:MULTISPECIES: enoyl-CoA hydratase-related protein [unclassified Arthrobacter]MCC9146712.1 enoyl-CoA hydratase-related protein [Arthrobacter sp. zg-Y919]MDK1277943.1 enoyl-CoA hydratase-related protein [Arthrobacter sp. zg.Y919]WIB03463.1 enoyl-CoA hydratase-related protein [Arthrobacter sp. zg-Y919]
MTDTNPGASSPVLTEISERTAVVTINRPDVRNALNRSVLDGLDAALDTLEADSDVGAVIFTGAGTKAFVAGADITQLAGYTLQDGLRARMQRLYDRVQDFDKPTIAAVNGYALGGGNELAMSCDIRIASTTARFGLPEANLGILPGAGGTQRLSRLVGQGRAKELILTGRIIDAEEALRIGLVTSVVPGEQLLDSARDTARTILAKGPLAVRLAKLVISGGAETDQRTGLLLERLAQSLLYAADEKSEGAAAFLEKRPARFNGTA